MLTLVTKKTIPGLLCQSKEKLNRFFSWHISIFAVLLGVKSVAGHSAGKTPGSLLLN